MLLKHHKLFICLFFTVLLLPILLSGFYIDKNEKYITKIEKRTVNQTPVILKNSRINNNFSIDFEKWLQDHIAFRPSIIKLYNKIFTKTSTKVLYGEDGYLFYKKGNSVNLFKRTIQLSDKEIAKELASFIHIAKTLQENGIKFYWLIPPNKHTVYPEYFPKNIKPVNKLSVLDQVLDYTKRHNLSDILNIIDLRTELLNNKFPNQELYYKTDTHWNQIGAFIGHNVLIKNLQRDFKNFTKTLNFDDFRISKSTFNGDLADMLAQKMKSTHYEFIPKHHEDIITELKTGKNFNTLNKTTQSPYTAMIYRDSFFDNLHQFTSHYFKKVDYISDKIRPEHLEEILAKKPDIVILETVERKV